MGKRTHNKTGNRIYNIYRGMKTRCYTSTDYHYQWYGTKGVKICDEWLNDFMAFYNWSINHGYSDELSIDRIDPHGDYSPDNCRWITHAEQCNNRRTNNLITIDGITHTISEWAKISGVHRKAIYRKQIKGITGKALLEPVITPTKSKIVQKDLEGNIIKIWNSLQEIKEKTNFCITTIANVCKEKKYFHTAYGFKWEYYKEEKD